MNPVYTLPLRGAAGYLPGEHVEAFVEKPVRVLQRTSDAAVDREHPQGFRAHIEGLVLVTILVIVGGLAGLASFTHVEDWTLANSPIGTGEWFGGPTPPSVS